MPKEAKDIITKTLGVEPIMINSALVSAQQRKRLYWTNVPSVGLPVTKDNLIAETICVNSQSGCRNGIRKQPSVADRIYDVNAKNPSLTSSYQTNIAEPIRLGDIGRGGQGNRIYSVKGKSVCLNANSGGKGSSTGLYKIDLPDGDYIIRKLYPMECERLQTLPDNYTLCEGVSNTQRYRCIGNAWTVDVIAHILKNLF